MIKCENGVVNIKGETPDIQADLTVIIRSVKDFCEKRMEKKKQKKKSESVSDYLLCQIKRL